MKNYLPFHSIIVMSQKTNYCETKSNGIPKNKMQTSKAFYRINSRHIPMNVHSICGCSLRSIPQSDVLNFSSCYLFAPNRAHCLPFLSPSLNFFFNLYHLINMTFMKVPLVTGNDDYDGSRFNHAIHLHSIIVWCVCHLTAIAMLLRL